jgi:PBP4 family serine-type D-alanyl-D-alanine carboxypeptidase
MNFLVLLGLAGFCQAPLSGLQPDVSFGALFGGTAQSRCDDNSRALFALASTTKIMTAAAALTSLDPVRPFDPVLHWQELGTGRIGNLELLGDGSADTWDEKTFQAMAALLVEKGVHEIVGPVAARAADPRWNSMRLPHWTPENASTCDTPLPRPFVLANACATVIIDGPGEAHWQDPTVKTAIQFQPSAEEPTWHWGDTPLGEEHRAPVVLRGKLKPGSNFQILQRDSEGMATELFHRALSAESGLVWNESSSVVISSGAFVTEHLPVAELSPSLAQFLKKSINLTGEVLLRKIGMQAYPYDPAASVDSPGGDSLVAGRQALLTYVYRQGSTVPANSFQIDDGCGLSYLTKGTAEGMLAVLEDIRRDPLFFAAYRDLLAVPGEEGTLQHRFPGLEDRLRAKTGTLSDYGAHNLAGFVRTQSGDDWASFAVYSHSQTAASGDQALTTLDDVVTQFATILAR